MRTHRRLFLAAVGAALIAGPGTVASAATTAAPGQAGAPDVAALVASFKTDPRGPFQSIRWFCPDGSVLPPTARCPEPGGVQHALAKDRVQALASEHGIHLGQILAGTPFTDFWTPEAQYGRAKQYALERYLVEIDDGWILRKARYYRGAFQAEDEEDWGRRFLTWLLDDQENLASHYFLIRQLAGWIPHGAGDDRLVRIRSLALSIAETEPRFMDLRIKIHSQPDASDLAAVRTFGERYAATLAPATAEMVARLARDLEASYGTTALAALKDHRGRLAAWPAVRDQLDRVLGATGESGSAAAAGTDLADLLWLVRERLLAPAAAADRLVLLDLSREAERALFLRSAEWRPDDLHGLATKAAVLVRAAAGCGFLEIWEYAAIAAELDLPDAAGTIRAIDLERRAALLVRTVEWCTGMAAATFTPAIRTYGFEPLAAGFIDACLRSSIVLPLGETAGQLAGIAARQTGVSSRVMDLAETGGFRGLNPGYALGTLAVVAGEPDQVDFQPDRIYALPRPPADLSPVAGILSVSAGNPVSHIQLLARNLGIPNAVLGGGQLALLQAHDGATVFFAVSPRGAVLMKPAAAMTPTEARLVTKEERRDEMVQVPVDRMDLSVARILDLRNLRADDSGRLCGPKAANLGELKFLFPEHVVAGVVLPFGVFFDHLDQPIPGRDTTYWQWLQDVFARAETMRGAAVAPAEIERQTLADLARFQAMIGEMPFQPGFVADLEKAFADVLGAPLGEIPVFVRSDTNMEDLSDFTGAGLNLTLFNLRDREAILQGIRQVWASPYSERSYRWRQRYLSNPENVFPSIVILPAVNVDKSGVMITTGVAGGSSRDLTVAFSRGVGGAVEGQIAESYLLRRDGRDELRSPSRETLYTTLPGGGGLARQATALDEPVLGEADRALLRRMGRDIRRKLGPTTDGTLDVELGLEGERIWLFQVRPFVENRKARGSDYLKSLDDTGNDNARIPWGSRLDTLR